jgi:adenosine/AMP kinase
MFCGLHQTNPTTDVALWFCNEQGRKLVRAQKGDTEMWQKIPARGDKNK